MPKIDQLVDATYGHPRMSFLDAFKGYHHIALAAGDQEKTTAMKFRTLENRWILCKCRSRFEKSEAWPRVGKVKKAS